MQRKRHSIARPSEAPSGTIELLEGTLILKVIIEAHGLRDMTLKIAICSGRMHWNDNPYACGERQAPPPGHGTKHAWTLGQTAPQAKPYRRQAINPWLTEGRLFREVVDVSVVADDPEVT